MRKVTLLGAAAALVLTIAPVHAEGGLERKITLTIRRETDLRDIIGTIARITKTNIVLDPKVRTRMQLDLKDIRASDALRVVAGINGLKLTEFNGIVVVATPETAKNINGPGEIIVKTLGYSKAEEMAPLLEKTQKDELTVVADPRTNSVIISTK